MKRPDATTMASVREVLAAMHEDKAFAVISRGSVFGDLYCDADMREALLGGMPVDLETIAASPLFKMTAEQFENAIFKEAVLEYPGIENHSAGLKTYFQMTESFPAIFHDPETKDERNTLLVYPIRSLDLFLVYAAPVEVIQDILEMDVKANEQYLRIFGQRPFDIVNGMTADLAADKRKMAEGNIRIFSEQTGIAAKDSIHAAFNRAFKAEMKRAGSVEHRDITQTLAQRAGMMTAFADGKLKDVTKSLALRAKIAHASDLKLRN